MNFSAVAAPCDHPEDPDAAISDCAQSINSGKWKGHALAAYYTKRATAYRTKRDLDRAIADFSEAIRLTPKSPFAFFARACI